MPGESKAPERPVPVLRGSAAFFSKSPLFLAFLLAFSLSPAFAKEPIYDESHPALILNSESLPRLPKNFRTSDSPYGTAAGKAPSREGLGELRISGSAQFSEQGLREMGQHMKGKVFIVDLRQESHGFVNGHAVSWFSRKNWANRGKTLQEIEEDEAGRLKALLAQGYVEINRVTRNAPDGEIADAAPFPAGIQNALTEKELVPSYGFGYCRIPVPDHSRPSDEDVDLFLEFYRSLPRNAWLHFHCRAGAGRTTTFMLMCDILKNGSNLGLEELGKRQVLLGGIDLLNSPPPKDNWGYGIYTERSGFLRDFYEYARQTEGGHSSSWSAWVKKTSQNH